MADAAQGPGLDRLAGVEDPAGGESQSRRGHGCAEVGRLSGAGLGSSLRVSPGQPVRGSGRAKRAAERGPLFGFHDVTNYFSS